MAVAKRAKDELASREAALRTLLQQERDKQLQVRSTHSVRTVAEFQLVAACYGNNRQHGLHHLARKAHNKQLQVLSNGHSQQMQAYLLGTYRHHTL